MRNSNAIDDVIAERRRQVTSEKHVTDDLYIKSELLRGALAYGLQVLDARGRAVPLALDGLTMIFEDVTGYLHVTKGLWPFDNRVFNPMGHRRNLVKAAALLIAEIERMDRAWK